jgi:NADPH:quinone reductase-like Zn-dependent oxidoreductase
MLQTVHGALFTSLNIWPGGTLLVRGGTSSIGLLAIQLAKKHELQVIATTRNKSREALLKAAGADQVVIDDGTIAGKVPPVNYVLELIGTSTLKDSLECAAKGGVVCVTGILSEQWTIADFAPMEFIPPAVYLTTSSSGHHKMTREIFQEYIKQVERRELVLPIGKVFHLQDIVAAHQLMDDNAAGGKIVIVNG